MRVLLRRRIFLLTEGYGVTESPEATDFTPPKSPAVYVWVCVDALNRPFHTGTASTTVVASHPVHPTSVLQLYSC